MKRSLRILIPLLLPALLLAAACGDDDDKAASTPSGASSIPAATVVTTVPSGGVEVDQKDLSFQPADVAGNTGSPIYFRNSESAIHTVTIEGKNVSGTMQKDMIVAWTPPAAGTYKVTCDYHPQMRATITVK